VKPSKLRNVFRISIEYCTKQAHWFFRYLKPGVRSQTNPCGIWGKQNGIETRFFPPGTSVLPCLYHSTNAPRSSSSESSLIRRTSGWSLGELWNRPISIRISGKQRSGIHNPIPAHCISHLRHSANYPPTQIPPGHNAISSRSPWHGHVKALRQDRKSVSQAQFPLQLQGIRATQHNNAFRHQERPPSTSLQRQLTFGWVTIQATVVSFHYAVRIRSSVTCAAYSCVQHGPVTTWFWSARTGNVIPVPKTLTLLRVALHCMSHWIYCWWG